MKTSFWQRWRPWALTSRRGRPAPRREPRLQVQQLEDRTVLSGTAHLLAHIDPGSSGPFPVQFVVIGSEAYFVASDATHDERVDDPNTSEQRDTADISQNTTNKAFFRGRRMK